MIFEEIVRHCESAPIRLIAGTVDWNFSDFCQFSGAKNARPHAVERMETFDLSARRPHGHDGFHALGIEPIGFAMTQAEG